MIRFQSCSYGALPTREGLAIWDSTAIKFYVLDYTTNAGQFWNLILKGAYHLQKNFSYNVSYTSLIKQVQFLFQYRHYLSF